MMRLLWICLIAMTAAVLPLLNQARADEPPVILVLGDSLSAAYGIPREAGWVALLQGRLQERGFKERVINASISGDTTAGGLTRLPTLLARHRPNLLLLELGANDGLRGLNPAAMGENLTRMIELAREAGSRVLLLGIRLPPNYGAAYNRTFQAVFTDIAAVQGVTLLPFLLEGVTEVPELMQEDGVHPAAAAQPRILDHVWPLLEPLLAPPSGG